VLCCCGGTQYPCRRVLNTEHSAHWLCTYIGRDLTGRFDLPGLCCWSWSCLYGSSERSIRSVGLPFRTRPVIFAAALRWRRFSRMMRRLPAPWNRCCPGGSVTWPSHLTPRMRTSYPTPHISATTTMLWRWLVIAVWKSGESLIRCSRPSADLASTPAWSDVQPFYLLTYLLTYLRFTWSAVRINFYFHVIIASANEGGWLLVLLVCLSPYWKSVFGRNSAADCLISVKCCIGKQVFSEFRK